MVTEFVRKYVSKIVKHPEFLSVESNMIDEKMCEIIIKASAIDAGRVIGKNGKMVGALRSVISLSKAKDLISYKITVIAKE